MADAFLAGMAHGAGAVSRGMGRKQQRRAEDLERQRVAIEERRQTQAELDGVIERRRQAMAAEDLDFVQQQKKDEMKRYMQAEGAWKKFQAAVQTIEWGQPTAPQQYQEMSQSYLPEILYHEGVHKKYEAFDKVTQQNARFQAAKMAQQSVTAAMHEAGQIAPELMLNPPKTPEGEIDYTAVKAGLEEARKKKFEEGMKWRQAYGSRARTSAGSRGRVPVLGDADKAMLASELKLLGDVRARLMEIDDKGTRTTQADRYGRLQNEERRIQKRIEDLRAKAAVPENDDELLAPRRADLRGPVGTDEELTGPRGDDLRRPVGTDEELIRPLGADHDDPLGLGEPPEE